MEGKVGGVPSSSQFSHLNINAPVFLPSFNFCPVTGNRAAEQNGGNVPPASASVEAPPECPESWEEEVSEDDEALEDEAQAPRIKKQPVRPEETKSKKEHVNVVFIGHVDAGKSTIGGQIMFLTGMVDKRTLEKYEREAKEKNRGSWCLSWVVDTNAEERDKGKTVEVGRASFQTEKKHFSILDAPGHKSFVPTMISGAAQADLAVLVISARKGKFETGFEKGGQTREHAMLVKSAGVKFLVVLINKMDDPTVEWSEERYIECKEKLLPFLRKLGFHPTRDLTFMPVSGLTGAGIKDPVPPDLCTWYPGLPFIPFIDGLAAVERKIDGPFILPIVGKYRDMGTVVMGKVESGEARKGQALLVMPNKSLVTVERLWSNDARVNAVGPGENVKLKLKGLDGSFSAGFVLCHPHTPCGTGRVFDAQVAILEYKKIICAGYSAMMHIHTHSEEVTLKAILCLVDKRTGEKSQSRPRFVRQDQVALVRLETAGIVCMESFKVHPQLGRFTLRDEEKTIAVGKVLKVIE